MDPAAPRRTGYRIGIALMAMSFASLPLYLAIPFLPVSLEAKARLAFVGWVASWFLFLLGTILAGNEGYRVLLRYVRSFLRKS
jgi:hypothetical protein